MKKELRKKGSLLMVTRWKKMFLKELNGCGGVGVRNLDGGFLPIHNEIKK